MSTPSRPRPQPVPPENDPEHFREVTAEEVAEMVATSGSNFRARAKSHGFPRTPSGRYVLGPTMLLYHATTRPRGWRPQTPADGAPGEGPVGGQHALELTKLAEQTRKLKLENDKRAGLLVEAAAVASDRFRAGRLTRDTVLGALPDIAQRLAATHGGDPRMIAADLDREVREVLHRLAREVGELGDAAPGEEHAA